jgi:hypothetical protein
MNTVNDKCWFFAHKDYLSHYMLKVGKRLVYDDKIYLNTLECIINRATERANQLKYSLHDYTIGIVDSEYIILKLVELKDAYRIIKLEQL